MRIVFVFLFLISFSFQAQAFVTSCINYDVENTHPDEIRVSHFVKCMRKGSEIWLDGGVDPYFIDELRVYNEEPIKVIHLNSGGGLVKDAFELAQFIRNNNIKTVVRKYAMCASACTVLFQAGTERQAHPKARFMYHSVRHLMISKEKQNKIEECNSNPEPECVAEIEETKQELVESTEEMFAKLEAFGASPQLQEDYFNLPKEQIWWESGNYVGIIDWWLTARTLKQYNVVTELIKGF